MDENDHKMLLKKAKAIRVLTIDALGYFGLGHIGGSMSIIEVLTILYYHHMTVKKEGNDRDQLILSKAHSGPALYSILADKGYFPKEWLHTLNKGGTNLPSHCDRIRTPGIDMTAGSLGQGLSVAVGLALANRINKINRKVYVIIGDGESNEGQIWEGAMSASQFKLNNIIAFTDNNKLQIDGYTQDVMSIDDITSKWLSFGWNVQRIDGHCFKSLDRAISRAKEETQRPSMIVLDTIKGKGANFAEGRVDSHHMTFDYETAKKAILELGELA